MKQSKVNNKEYRETLEKIMTFKNLDNSYKLLWLKAISDEVSKGNTVIAFEQLAIRMLAESWELVFVKNLTYGRLDKVHRILEEIDDLWHVDYDLTAEEAVNFMQTIAIEELRPLLADLYEDTPFRFFEPLYGGKLKGKKEGAKNQLLEELINQDTKSLYAIDTQDKSIAVRKEWAIWIKSNKKQVDALFKDTMAYYLDKNAGKR